MQLKVKLLHENVMALTRETKDSPGLDLFAIEDVMIPPATVREVGSGVSVCVPEGMYATVVGAKKLHEKNYWLIWK